MKKGSALKPNSAELGPREVTLRGRGFVPASHTQVYVRGYGR